MLCAHELVRRRAWLQGLVDLTNEELPGGHTLFPLMQWVQTVFEVRSLGDIGSRIMVGFKRLRL